MQKKQWTDTTSNGTMFFLLGFSDLSLAAQGSLFVFFLFSYLLALVGNGLIIVAVTLSPRLRSPMYFFLRSLSFAEIWSISSTVPKALLGFFIPTEHLISFVGCAFQFFSFIIAAACECTLLTVMAYDRYMAICHPLRYTAVMTAGLCYRLTILCWIFGGVYATIGCCVLFTLPYCGSHLIAHFFCDIPPLISIACTNTFFIEVYLLLATIIATIPSMLLVFCSYGKILTSIFLLQTTKSRHKVFSTCSSHMVSVIIFYGTVMFVHFRLENPFTPYEDRMLALSYCVIIPTINPLIYSLKNKDMKEAIRKLPMRMISS